MPHIRFAMAEDFGNPSYPPTINLHRSQIVAAVCVQNLGTNPSTFLVAQSPQRPFKPLVSRPCLRDTFSNLRFVQSRQF